MTEYTWTIATLEYNNDDAKGVVIAHWGTSAADGDYTASAYGTAGFTPDPEQESFIPFEELTEADVLGWVWGSLDKDEVEANLAKQIEDQKAPKTVAGTPWG